MDLISGGDRIYVAGHRGMLGAAIWRALEAGGFTNLVGFTSSEVDLRSQNQAFDAVATTRPDVLVLAAAKVGGIGANMSLPVEFLNDNIRIQTNVLEAAHHHGVRRLLFLASSCVYPKGAPQPLREEALLTGPFEPTNASYAIAKVAGLQAISSYREQYHRDWISAIPCNLYGPGDNYELSSAHVLAALLRRFHQASVEKEPTLELWGSGRPRREFLHVDDCASACVLLLRVYSSSRPINVGSGTDVSIAALAEMAARITGYGGRVEWNPRYPDGIDRKLMDSQRMRSLGWTPRVELEEGIESTYRHYASTFAP